MEDITTLDADYSFKVLILGDSSVGKTNLLSRFTKDEFSATTKYTIGVEFGIYRCVMKGKQVEAKFWDTAGQERYRSILPIFYRGMDGVILVFDVTSEKSFCNIKDHWLPEIKKHVDKVDFEEFKNNGSIVLLGNKNDLKSIRKVTKQKAIEFANENGIVYFDTSAKDCYNVKHSFLYLIHEIVNYNWNKKYDVRDLLSSPMDDKINAPKIVMKKITKKKCKC